MKIVVLSIICTFFLSTTAMARKPAVEDFVGIETEHFDKTPAGTEVVFEFGNMVQAKTPLFKSSNSSLSNIVPGLMILGFVSLPFLMWFGITRKTKSLTQVVSHHEEEDFTPNVTNLDDFRRTETQEDIKKAS